MRRLTVSQHLGWLIIIIVAVPSLFLFVLSQSVNGVTIYKWVDKKGVVNFTDDYSQIPSEYRNQVHKQEFGESTKVETPAPSPASTQKSKMPEVDIYSMGEDYWRAKVQPWKEQLKKATENIEGINRKISENLKEEAGKSLSRTQWTMDLAYRKQLIEERSTYEAQVREANEMLSKIAKEAEEAKANPEWLK